MIEVKKGPAVGDEIVTGPFKVLRQVKEGDKVAIEKEGDKKKEEDEEGVTPSESSSASRPRPSPGTSCALS